MQLDTILPTVCNPVLLQQHLQLLAARSAAQQHSLTQLQQRTQQLLQQLTIGNSGSLNPQTLFELYQNSPNPEQQLPLLRQAASLGLKAAQQHLAECYQHGQGGVPQNPLAAAYWLGQV